MTTDRWILDLVNAMQGNGILLYVLLTTVIAGVLSALIGLERQLRGEAAGVRTHALIAIASSLLMTISVWAIRMADGSIDIVTGMIERDLNYDTSRIAAAAVTGIGFLGGGVIIKDKFSVHGLATAATLWICTAIGLACGAGFILGAVITTAVVLIALITLTNLIEYLDSRYPAVVVTADSGFPLIEVIRDFSEKNGLTLRNVRVLRCGETETAVAARFMLDEKDLELDYICRQLSALPEVRAAVREERDL